MMPVNFQGAKVIGKPKSMTDEQCSSVYAQDVDINYGKDKDGNDVIGRMWIECWQPSKEDIEAINQGRPIWLQIHSIGLPPIAVLTTNEKGEPNV